MIPYTFQNYIDANLLALLFSENYCFFSHYILRRLFYMRHNAQIKYINLHNDQTTDHLWSTLLTFFFFSCCLYVQSWIY